MTLLPALQLLAYTAIIVFVIAIIVKVSRYLRMPIHLRWELYPVPHEAGAEHGGSYFEEEGWWRKERRISRLNELKDMLGEMLFIKRVYTYNRSLWWFTYPFHLGIYLMLAWFALLIVGAITEAAGIPITLGEAVNPEPWPTLIHYLTILAGSLGIILVSYGALSLLIKRASSQEMRLYSSPIDYFNLLFILAVALTGAASWRMDPNFAIAREFMKALITFTAIPTISMITSIHIILLSFLFIYIPFTKMLHFIAKYFTYHQVLWEDEPNVRGGDVERRVMNVLRYKVSWGAPHVKPDITWVEEAKS